MSPSERRPTLTDCGCEATVYADGSGIELHYCPMHQAAKELLEALQAMMLWVNGLPLDLEVPIPQALAFIAARNKVDAAIKAAGG